MNEPFLLSNLIDLQDIDNEITKLITKKYKSARRQKPLQKDQRLH